MPSLSDEVREVLWGQRVTSWSVIDGETGTVYGTVSSAGEARRAAQRIYAEDRTRHPVAVRLVLRPEGIYEG